MSDSQIDLFAAINAKEYEGQIEDIRRLFDEVEFTIDPEGQSVVAILIGVIFGGIAGTIAGATIGYFLWGYVGIIN